jgi:hypothetical protein
MPREQLIAKPADIEWEDPKVKNSQNGFPVIKCEPMRSFSSISEKLFNVVVDKCERPDPFVGRKKSKKSISAIQNACTGFTKRIRGSQIPKNLPSVFHQEIDYTLVTFRHKSDIVQPDVEFQQAGRAKEGESGGKSGDKTQFSKRHYDVLGIHLKVNGLVVLDIAKWWQIKDTAKQKSFDVFKPRGVSHHLRSSDWVFREALFKTNI